MTLKQEVLDSTILTNMILSPLSNEDNWQDIEIVSLNQHAKDQASDSVLSNITSTDCDINELIENELLHPKYSTGHEFIDVQQNKTIIGVMCDKVTDRVTDRAIRLLMDIKDVSFGVHIFPTVHTLDFSCLHVTDIV